MMVIIIIISNILIILNSHLSQSMVVPTSRAKDNQAICPKKPMNSETSVRLCYMCNVRLRSMVIWFTTPTLFFETFQFYRFILRSIDEISLATIDRFTLTNYTELIDRNNTLRLYNLESGQYELCLEFQSNETWFSYQNSDHCLAFRLGHLSHHSFRQSSTELLLTLTMSISLFFILGLVVQWSQSKRNMQQGPSTPRARASSLLSTVSLKKQRDRIIRTLFRRHMDQSEDSQLRQWARNRAFRHRISTQDSQIERRGRPLAVVHEDDQSSSAGTINDIYIVPWQETPDQKEDYFVI